MYMYTYLFGMVTPLLHVLHVYSVHVSYGYYYTQYKQKKTTCNVQRETKIIMLKAYCMIVESDALHEKIERVHVHTCTCTHMYM